MNWKAQLRLLGALAVAIIFAKHSKLSVYLVEEGLTVLLGIALLVILILLTAITFLLLWQGASLAFFQLKEIVGRITSKGHRPLRVDQAMSHPFLRH